MTSHRTKIWQVFCLGRPMTTAASGGSENDNQIGEVGEQHSFFEIGDDADISDENCKCLKNNLLLQTRIHCLVLPQPMKEREGMAGRGDRSGSRKRRRRR